jgi:hypothetical protein
MIDRAGCGDDLVVVARPAQVLEPLDRGVDDRDVAGLGERDPA